MTANKAILAAVLAGLTSILADLRGADNSLSVQDWVVTVLAAVVVGLGVYVVPNRALPRRGQGGYGAVELAIGAVVLVILVVVLLQLL